MLELIRAIHVWTSEPFNYISRYKIICMQHLIDKLTPKLIII